MVKGQLQALGTPQHLKQKFGSGYEIIIKLGPTEEEMSEAKAPTIAAGGGGGGGGGGGRGAEGTTSASSAETTRRTWKWTPLVRRGKERRRRRGRRAWCGSCGTFSRPRGCCRRTGAC